MADMEDKQAENPADNSATTAEDSSVAFTTGDVDTDTETTEVIQSSASANTESATNTALKSPLTDGSNLLPPSSKSLGAIPKVIPPPKTLPNLSLPFPYHANSAMESELRKRVGRSMASDPNGIFVSAPSGPRAPSQSDSRPPRPDTMSIHEYAQLFNQWLCQQYWMQQQMNWMTWMYFTAPLMAATAQLPPTGATQPQATMNGDARLAGAFNIFPAAVPQHNTQQPPQPAGRECKIPTLSRRVAAEFLDFLLVFSVKLIVSIIAVDNGFSTGDSLFQTIPTTDLETLLTMNWDPNVALSITTELILMEIINRIFICIFEAVCLSYLGATPGKRMMGIRVIACKEFMEMPGNRIRILPAGKMPFGNSIVRAVVKNFSLAFFFPVCLTVFFFPHNRTGYDVLSSSIVVELPEDDIWAIHRRR